MITRRKLNKKLDLLLQRQNFMMEIILQAHFSYDGCKKLKKKWNNLWKEIMEDKHEDTRSK